MNCSKCGEERLVRQPPLVALAMPKSITFGTGTPSCSVTRMFDGLMSRWMMPFWCACWMAWQTWMNRSSRSRGGQIVLVAVLGDLDAAHQFHHEVRPARVGRAGVEHLGDVRMIHHRQRLPLGLEARDHLLGVHAELDNFQRNAASKAPLSVLNFQRVVENRVRRIVGFHVPPLQEFIFSFFSSLARCAIAGAQKGDNYS